MTVYNMVSGKLSKTTRLSQNCLNMCIRKKWKLVSQNVNNDCFQVLKIWMITNPSSHFTMIKFCAFFIMEKYIHDKMQCFKIGFEFFRSLSSKKTGFFFRFFHYISHNLLVIKEVFIEYLLVMYQGLFWMLVIILVNKADLKSGRKDSFISLFSLHIMSISHSINNVLNVIIQLYHLFNKAFFFFYYWTFLIFFTIIKCTIVKLLYTNSCTQ